MENYSKAKQVLSDTGSRDGDATVSVGAGLPVSLNTYLSFLCTASHMRGALGGEMDAGMTAEIRLRSCSCLCASPSHSPEPFQLCEGSRDALPDLLK